MRDPQTPKENNEKKIRLINLVYEVLLMILFISLLNRSCLVEDYVDGMLYCQDRV